MNDLNEESMNRKHILIILSILLLLPWGGYGAKAKKAVFIIVDGVPADMIERLKKEYPLSDCTLDYEHAWQLLLLPTAE